jgi:hypothetical protein
MVAIGDRIYGQDLNRRRGMFPSNRDHRSSDGQLTAPNRAPAALTGRRSGTMAGLTGVSRAADMGHGGGRS